MPRSLTSEWESIADAAARIAKREGVTDVEYVCRQIGQDVIDGKIEAEPGAIIAVRRTLPDVWAREKLFITADRSRIVPDGQHDAAILYATPGDPIPREEARRLGILDGRVPTGDARDPPEADVVIEYKLAHPMAARVRRASVDAVFGQPFAIRPAEEVAVQRETCGARRLKRFNELRAAGSTSKEAYERINEEEGAYCTVDSIERSIRRERKKNREG